MSEVKLNVRLISYTPEAEKLTAMAAKLCYSPSGIDDISENLTEDKAAAFIEKIVDIGHLSTIEHASFSFGIAGVSRTLLAQITRHGLPASPCSRSATSAIRTAFTTSCRPAYAHWAPTR